MGTDGTRGTNYFSPEINELQWASRLCATRATNVYNSLSQGDSLLVEGPDEAT